MIAVHSTGAKPFKQRRADEFLLLEIFWQYLFRHGNANRYFDGSGIHAGPSIGAAVVDRHGNVEYKVRETCEKHDAGCKVLAGAS